MKSLQQIKNALHEYIDGINDESLLMVIYEQILNYLKNDTGKVETSENDSFSNYQEKEIDITIPQTSAEDIKREKELKKSMARWFNEGGKNP